MANKKPVVKKVVKKSRDLNPDEMEEYLVQMDLLIRNEPAMELADKLLLGAGLTPTGQTWELD